MDMRLALFVLSFLVIPADAWAAGPSKEPPRPYVVEACSDGTPNALHFDVTHVQASRVLSDIMRVSHMRIEHAERIDNHDVGLKFPCLPTLTAIQLLIADNGDSLLVLEKEFHGSWKLLPLRHRQQIETLRKTLNEQVTRQDKAGVKQTALLIMAAAENVGKDEAVDDDTSEYLLLTDMALTDRQWDDAERIVHRQMSLLQRMNNEESPVYALASVKLARIHGLMQKPDADDLLKHSLPLLEKYPDDFTMPALARTYAELAGKAAKADDYATAEDLSARGWEVMEKYDHVSGEEQKWDEAEAFWARVAIDQEEGQIGFGLGAKDRPDDALVHFRRLLRLAEKFGDDSVLMLDYICDVVALTSWQDNDLDMAARAILRQLDREEKKSSSDVSRIYLKSLFDLTVIRAKQEQFSAASDTWRKMIDVRHRVVGENDSGARAAFYDLALLQRLNGNPDEAVRTEKDADTHRVAPGQSAPTATPTLLRQLDRHLAETLYTAYAQREEELAKTHASDEAAFTLVQQRKRMCLDAVMHATSTTRP